MLSDIAHQRSQSLLRQRKVLVVAAAASPVVALAPPVIGAVPVAVGLLGRAARLALLLGSLAFLAAIAPTLVVALAEAADGLDHAEVMVGVLPVGFRHDAVARCRRLARQRLVLVEDLVGVAAHAHVGPA